MFNKCLIWLFLVLGGCAFPHEIKGRFVDHFTGKPIPRVSVYERGNQKVGVSSDENGDFTITADGPTASFPFWPGGCHEGGYFVLRERSSVEVYSLNAPLGGARFPVQNLGADVGNVSLRPTVSLRLYADKTVSALISYPGEARVTPGWGWRKEHFFPAAIPLDYAFQVVVFEANKTHRSDVIRVSLERGCQDIVLLFAEGKFNWMGLTQK